MNSFYYQMLVEKGLITEGTYYYKKIPGGNDLKYKYNFVGKDRLSHQIRCKLMYGNENVGTFQIPEMIDPDYKSYRQMILTGKMFSNIDNVEDEDELDLAIGFVVYARNELVQYCYYQNNDAEIKQRLDEYARDLQIVSGKKNLKQIIKMKKVIEQVANDKRATRLS